MSFGQGGPYGPGDGPSSTPDWSALADESAARDRRRRWMFVGGGALATVVVAGIVAAAVVMNSGSDDPQGKDTALPSQQLPDRSAEPKPSFSDVSVPPPPNPVDYYTDPKKDTAPLTPASLYPMASVNEGGRTYTRRARDTTDDCTSAAVEKLVSVLKAHDCRRMVRATYVRNNVATTIGIAVFPDKGAATKAFDANQYGLAPLTAGSLDFCHGSDCLNSVSMLGRYVYYTLTGYTSGKDVTRGDATIQQVSTDAKTYAFGRIQQRGENQAAAAAREQKKQLQQQQQQGN
ncbi:hypothetical protein ACFV3R_07165 [Streptomyces sp. NPDC059740]|uniref:hypothetical protein n=1 Tax=Streptomyces sp. NPDC059740 TaxID=3346926 RepID=UPI003667A377